MKPIFIDEGRQRRFERDGFVVLRLMSAQEAGSLRAQLPALRSDARFEANTPAGGYHASLHDPDRDYRRRARIFAEAVLAERLAPLLDDYRFLTGGLLIKPPGGAEIEIHRDWTMTPTPEEVALNCWCALGDVDEANGALALVPGSHRLVANIEAPGIAPFFSAYCDRLKAHSLAIPLAAGEAVIFDYRSLHWSTANCSAVARCAVSAAFVPRRSRAVLFLPDRVGGERRFRIVEPEAEAWVDRIDDPADAPTIGYVRDDNRAVSLAEFERLLAARDGGSPSRLVDRLRSWLRAKAA